MTGSPYERLCDGIAAEPRTWLVTGCAGFIGSHLVERLLRLGQRVVGLDDLSTGRRENVAEVSAAAPPGSFTFLEADIRDREACRRACDGVEHVLHQAALGSVPRSIRDPLTTHAVNVDGFLNVLVAARDAKVRSFVYASSSSVYGDHPQLPKVEEQVGRPLSPYAVSKATDEAYAAVFHRCYGVPVVGLRYFNVFGPRQDPAGPYAAVMPLWFAGLLAGHEVAIHGDGETSRDFCFVENVVQANLLAALADREDARGRVYNVAFGERTTLNELFSLIREQVARFRPEAARREPSYQPFRPGDIRHSLADITAASELLGYAPTHSVRQGLALTAGWYAANVRAPSDGSPPARR